VPPQRFSADGDPVSSGGRGDGAKNFLSYLPPILLGLIAGAGVWLIWQAFTSPTPASISPQQTANDYSVSPVSSTFPPQLLEAAVAISTFIAPTPEPTPTPRPTAIATSATIQMVCGDGLERGSICTMPTQAPPSPTPYPVCPTTPGFDCVWMGSQMGTPLATSGAERSR
jgi:hypothetical protein